MYPITKHSAEAYLSAGLVATPASKAGKLPILPSGLHASWKTLDTETAKARWTSLTEVQDAIAIICGSCSGNVEIIDFDHAGIKYEPWSALIPAALLAKLVIERSPSGGIHAGYRCDRIEGNLKLAYPPKPAEKGEDWKAYIETRGHGGLCLVAPSPGYVAMQLTWDQVQQISPDERDILISAARSLSEYVPAPKAPKPAVKRAAATTMSGYRNDDMKPGERYNMEASYSTTMGLLTGAGWTETGDGHVIRPGKESGNSGSVGDSGGFHCFTSSNAEFSGGETYTPFGVYAILSHGGDFSAAARKLAEEYGMHHAPKPATGMWESDAMKLLEKPEAKAEVKAATPDFALSSDLLDKLPQQIRHLATHLAMKTSGVIDARHVMLAIAGYAALIGKHAKFSNWGIDYYLNLATVILSASGTGKSNLKALLSDLLRTHMVEVSDLTTATAEGVIDQYSMTVSGKCADKAQKRMEAREETAKQAGVCIMTDELLALTGSILREQEAAKYARLLCKMLDTDTITCVTKRDGTAIWNDQCVNLIGLSQVDSFDGALRTPMFKESGLSGRIIPVNDKMAKWDMTPCEGSIHADAQALINSGRWNVHFGSGDKLKEAIETIEAMAAEQVPVMFEDWKQIRSKILLYGAKVAAILAILHHISSGKKIESDPFQEATTRIDASPWAAVGMALVHSCHASNLYYVGAIGQQHDKVRQIIEIKGACSKRDICTYTGWDSTTVWKLLTDLIEHGTLMKIPSHRTMKFGLVNNC